VKLQEQTNAETRQKIIDEHVANLAKITDQIESQKLQQLNKLQEQLINRSVDQPITVSVTA